MHNNSRKKISSQHYIFCYYLISLYSPLLLLFFFIIKYFNIPRPNWLRNFVYFSSLRANSWKRTEVSSEKIKVRRNERGWGVEWALRGVECFAVAQIFDVWLQHWIIGIWATLKHHSCDNFAIIFYINFLKMFVKLL